MGTRGGNSEATRNHKGWQKVIFRYLFSTINIVCNRKDRWKQEEESK